MYPWDENKDSNPGDDTPSLLDMASSPTEVEAALDVRQAEIAKAEILSHKPFPLYPAFLKVAKGDMQLGMLSIICFFEMLPGPAPQNRGHEKPKGLFMRQDALAELFGSSQPSVSKALKALSDAKLITSVEQVWRLNWAQINSQAAQKSKKRK